MTPATHALLSRLLAAPLELVGTGSAAIGYVGFDVPPDLLWASGRPFLHLPWRSRRPTPLADRWLESAFPGWARSILQDWLEGIFDGIPVVVFTRGDDAAQRLYYYLCELQRRGIAGGPQPLIFDVATIPRPSSLLHTQRALANLLQQLQIDADALGAGLAVANAQRRFFADLEARSDLAGSLLENVARAALCSACWPALQQLPLPTVVGARRVLLAGSVPADDTLHQLIEACGWNVAGSLHQLALGRLGAPIEVGEQGTLAALARHCHASTSGSRAFVDRARLLLDAVHRRQAHAVVLWLTEEDEALAWQVVRQRQQLAEAGIPALILTRQRWEGSEATSVQIRHFLQELSR